jgi:VWFA-related protein
MFGFLCAAQPPPADQTPTFRTGVNLVLVPVVVRDGQGRVVTSLEQKDFELFDRGRGRSIVRFSLEAAPVPVAPAGPAPTSPAGVAPTTPATPAQPQRFTAFVFDDMNTPPEDILRSREATLSLLDAMRPSDRFAVYTTTNTVQADFTADRDQLRTALGRVAGRRSLPAASPEVSYYLADQILNRNDRGALDVVMREVKRTSPGTPRQMLEPVARNAARAALQDGEMRTRQTLAFLEGAVRRLVSLPGQRAVLVVSSGFHVPQQQVERNRLIDKAARANVQIHAIDTRGVYADSTYGADRQGFDREGMAYERDAALRQSDVLAEAAEGTGGRFIRNSNDLRAGLVQLAAAPEAFYLLGFAPEENDLDGRFHELKVRLSGRRGLQVTARRGYLATRESGPPPDPLKEKSRELLMSRIEVPGAGFHWSLPAAPPPRAELRIRLGSVALREEGPHAVATLWATIGLFDTNGALLSDETKRVSLKLPRDSVAQAAEQSLLVTFELPARAGAALARAALWNQDETILSARNLPVP